MLVLVSKSYSYVRFIGDQGDYEDANGWLDEGTLMTVKEAIKELTGYHEPSCCPLTPSSCEGVSFRRFLDCYDCDEEEGPWDGGDESIFVKRADGSPLASRQLFRMFRAARLAAGRV